MVSSISASHKPPDKETRGVSSIGGGGRSETPSISIASKGDFPPLVGRRSEARVEGGEHSIVGDDLQVSSMKCGGDVVHHRGFVGEGEAQMVSSSLHTRVVGGEEPVAETPKVKDDRVCSIAQVDGLVGGEGLSIGIVAGLNQVGGDMIQVDEVNRVADFKSALERKDDIGHHTCGGMGFSRNGSDAQGGEPKGDASVTKPSYSAIVGSGMSVQNPSLEIEIVDGEQIGIVPAAVVDNIQPLWSELLVGRFASKAPHVGKVHMIVNKIWPLGNKDIKIDAYEVNDHMVKFRIRDTRTRARVLRRCMWNIAGVPMFLSKWAPAEERDDSEVKVMPIWVTLKNVPRSMFHEPGLRFLARAVGKDIRLHPDTELCSKFDEAKVLVEVDLLKPMPKSHKFRPPMGSDFTIIFHYPWVPSKCEQCNQWGHQQEACIINMTKDSEEQKLQETKTGKDVVTVTTKLRDAEQFNEKDGDTQRQQEVVAQKDNEKQDVDFDVKRKNVSEGKNIQHKSHHLEGDQLDELRDNLVPKLVRNRSGTRDSQTREGICSRDASQGITPFKSPRSNQPSPHIEKWSWKFVLHFKVNYRSGQTM